MMNETPRWGHAPIAMRKVSKEAFLERPDAKVGDFYFGLHCLWVLIPSGAGTRRFVPVRLPLRPGVQIGSAWDWDGNEERPTLTPSVHTHGHWHGFITKGELVEA